MNTVNSDTRRDKLIFIRWHLLCDSLMNGQMNEDIRFLDATVTKRSMDIWMRERRKCNGDVTNMIASHPSLSDDELKTIVPQGFLKYVQTSATPEKALRGIAGLLCDADRVFGFIKMLYAEGLPDWCRTREPAEPQEINQLLAAAMKTVSYDEAVEQVLRRVSRPNNGFSNNPSAHRCNNGPNP